MSFPTSKRPFLPGIIAFFALLVSAGLSGSALAHQSASPANQANPNAPDSTQDAFAHLVPVGGAPASGGTIAAGTKFTLDLYVNTGSNRDATAGQQYMTFDNTILQVVSPGGTSCTPAQTVQGDHTTFEAELQNEVCNGPNPCEFRGMQVPGGKLAYASGALTNCPTGCGGDLKVASITFCAPTGGRATIHWEFAPPEPVTRDCQIVSFNSDLIQNRSLYHDYVINVTGPTATPGPPTWTPRPEATSAPPAGTPTTQPGGSCNMTFRDVAQGDPFFQYIRQMYCRQVISGYNDNTFRPYDYTMRAQIVKIVVKAFGFATNTNGGPHFKDVPAGSEFYNYVETAANMNIVSGFNDGTFRPWDNVKRGQLAKIVITAANKKDPTGWALANPGTPSFSDVPKSNTFYQYVETAKQHNLIAGFDGGTYGVDQLAKRGQICKIVSGAPIP